jgi:hypothetical protein
VRAAPIGVGGTGAIVRASAAEAASVTGAAGVDAAGAIVRDAGAGGGAAGGVDRCGAPGGAATGALCPGVPRNQS